MNPSRTFPTAFLRKNLAIPERIGPYIIVKRIGMGATSAVYLGCMESGRQVAIKQLLPWQNKAIYRSMFSTEAKLAGLLRHPNIVSILDADLDYVDGAYLVLEYVDGICLDEHAKPDCLLALPVLLRTMQQVVEGLFYAFKCGIVHRDLKPGNIIVSNIDSSVKLMDFGCAIIDSSAIPGIEIAGSLSYMSPEQVCGNEIDHRSDIYSVGAVLYRLLCGQNSFVADNADEMIAAILAGKKVPIDARRSGLPHSVVEIVDRCMQPEAANRYQSHKELLSALHDAATDSVGIGEIDRAYIAIAMNSCNFFKDFTAHQIWEVLRSGSIRVFEPNERIMNEGEHQSALFILLKGVVSIQKNGKPLNVISKGDCIGEDMFFSNVNCHSTAIASETTVTVEISKNRFESLSELSQSKLGKAMLASISSKLHISNSRISR